MKKIGYILALVLEIAALAGAYIIHYFTRRKLGMVRYLNFKNMTWERDYPMGALKTGCVAVVAVLTVLVLLLFSEKEKGDIPPCIRHEHLYDRSDSAVRRIHPWKLHGDNDGLLFY